MTLKKCVEWHLCSGLCHISQCVAVAQWEVPPPHITQSPVTTFRHGSYDLNLLDTVYVGFYVI